MTRLDTELVRRGLARSRRRAADLVADGRVAVGGSPARKPSVSVSDRTELVVDAGREWVSRGAHKLVGALDDLASLGTPLAVADAECLDAGASTGGFTEVLLDAGARHVLAVDVGHGQIDARLASDPRVTVIEGANVRDLEPVDPAPSVLVADLSFISLTLVLDALARTAAPGAQMLVLVKPQFEVGKAGLGNDGVVSDPELRRDAVLRVARAVPDPFQVDAVLPSHLPGPAGNLEYFLHLTDRVAAGRAHRRVDLRGDIETAVDRALRGTASLVRPRAGAPRRPS